MTSRPPSRNARRHTIAAGTFCPLYYATGVDRGQVAFSTGVDRGQVAFSTGVDRGQVAFSTGVDRGQVALFTGDDRGQVALFTGRDDRGQVAFLFDVNRGQASFSVDVGRGQVAFSIGVDYEDSRMYTELYNSHTVLLLRVLLHVRTIYLSVCFFLIWGIRHLASLRLSRG